jgi:hypothetical protein
MKRLVAISICLIASLFLTGCILGKGAKKRFNEEFGGNLETMGFTKEDKEVFSVFLTLATESYIGGEKNPEYGLKKARELQEFATGAGGHVFANGKVLREKSTMLGHAIIGYARAYCLMGDREKAILFMRKHASLFYEDITIIDPLCWEIFDPVADKVIIEEKKEEISEWMSSFMWLDRDCFPGGGVKDVVYVKGRTNPFAVESE